MERLYLQVITECPHTWWIHYCEYTVLFSAAGRIGVWAAGQIKSAIPLTCNATMCVQLLVNTRVPWCLMHPWLKSHESCVLLVKWECHHAWWTYSYNVTTCCYLLVMGKGASHVVNTPPQLQNALQQCHSTCWAANHNKSTMTLDKPTTFRFHKWVHKTWWHFCWNQQLNMLHALLLVLQVYHRV